jgi:hypothetical protein
VPNRAQKLFNKSLGIDEIVNLFFAALKNQGTLLSKLRKTHRQRLENNAVCAVSPGIDVAQFPR